MCRFVLTPIINKYLYYGIILYNNHHLLMMIVVVDCG